MRGEKGTPLLFQYLLRLGDDRLVLGHRLSEWCGHGPILEEDIALTNIALDLIGQANLLLGLAGTAEGKGRDADALAYLRDPQEFRNHPIVELPRGDFAFTMVRQLLFDSFAHPLLEGLTRSTHRPLAGVAAKAGKEVRYHLRHSAEWVVRLGDGTAESHERAQRAVNDLWRWTGTLFLPDEVEAAAAASGLGPALEPLAAPWRATVAEVLRRATLDLPDPSPPPPQGRGYRRGDHTEHLGHLLAEMQVLARTHGGAEW